MTSNHLAHLLSALGVLALAACGGADAPKNLDRIDAQSLRGLASSERLDVAFDHPITISFQQGAFDADRVELVPKENTPFLLGELVRALDAQRAKSGQTSRPEVFKISPDQIGTAARGLGVIEDLGNAVVDAVDSAAQVTCFWSCLLWGSCYYICY
jgi:hypothetical protein